LESLAGSKLAERVALVADGVDAMEYLRGEGKYAHGKRHLPAVAVLDVKMPRMDGFEVLQAIRADPALRHVPVVMLTSSKEEADVVRCYRYGSNAYVVKPVVFVDFMAVIRQIATFWGELNELPPEGADIDGR